MFRCACLCLFLGAVAYGQTTTPASQTSAQKPSVPAASAATASSAAELPADAAVITIQGSCSNATAGKNASDCKTVVTRAEFEALIRAFAPNVPQAAQSRMAMSYGEMLVVANEAHKRGLDQTPAFHAKMAVSRLQLLGKELDSQLQAEAAQIPQQDLEAYYKEHEANFQEADLQRIAIPLRKQMEAPKEKLSDEETKKREQEAQNAMKKEAEAIHARAVAGEDFDKLQQEVYNFAGFKISAPSTKLMNVRRSALPNDQVSVFELKAGEISALLTTPTGYAIYKVDKKDAIPLDKAQTEIEQALSRQRFQALRQAVMQSGTPVLNDAYFTAPSAPAPAAPAPGGQTGNNQTPPKPPAPGPK